VTLALTKTLLLAALVVQTQTMKLAVLPGVTVADAEG